MAHSATPEDAAVLHGSRTTGRHATPKSFEYPRTGSDGTVRRALGPPAARTNGKPAGDGTYDKRPIPRVVINAQLQSSAVVLSRQRPVRDPGSVVPWLNWHHRQPDDGTEVDVGHPKIWQP